jgi:hypothetical protein
MDPVLIALRAQDFHESLRNTAASAPKEIHYEKTLLVGKAASLAMHFRGLQYVTDEVQLKCAAASLGISTFELGPVLKELEEIDFISVSRTADRIKRIDIRVPAFRSGYEELGKRWVDLRPTEVEQASVGTLEQLRHGPVRQDALQRSLSLDETGFAIMGDVMRAGELLAI